MCHKNIIFSFKKKSLLKDMFIDLRDRQRERERERERETSMWERNIDQVPPTYTLTGDKTHNLVCALTGNQTRNFLVYGMILQQSHLTKAAYDL